MQELSALCPNPLLHLSQAINIGEVLENWVPEELFEEEKVEGRWWRQLLAGGGAGAGELRPALCHMCSVLVSLLQFLAPVQLHWTGSKYSSR